MSNNTKTILALLTGAFAGTALGIFFASGKGAKMMGKLSKSVEDTTDTLEEKGKDTMSDFKEKLYQKVSQDHNGTGHDKFKKNKQHS